MIFITTKLIEGQAFEGKRIEADSWKEAERKAADEGCQIAGELMYEHFQEPL